MTVMTSWDLFDDLRSAQDEMVRMSGMPGQWAGQFGHQSRTGTAGQAWVPAVDITERKDAYLVACELPGVGAEEVEITFQDGLLTIQGDRQPVSDTKAEKVHRSERRFGTVRRSITLPTHVRADKIEASAQDGVLVIVVPKAADEHAKRIQVRTGKIKPAVAGSAAKNGA